MVKGRKKKCCVTHLVLGAAASSHVGMMEFYIVKLYTLELYRNQEIITENALIWVAKELKICFSLCLMSVKPSFLHADGAVFDFVLNSPSNAHR